MTLQKYINNLIVENLSLNEGLKLIRGVGKNETGNVDLFGKGLYLTDDLSVAKFYGDKIKQYDITGSIFDTTRNFTSSELTQFLTQLDVVFKTNLGRKYLKQITDYEEDELADISNEDYIGISWALDSTKDFQDLLKKYKLNTNDFNSYANVCTAMNLVLQKMGYIGLKYSTSEIEDLDDIGLGNKNAYVVFDNTAITEII
jgi:hypothetical protein